MARTIGIVREWKTDLERRSPLVPTDLEKLRAGGLDFIVEPSPVRIFPDADFAAAGATIADDLTDADFLLGIKEMPIDRIQAGKPHLFFSHTIKGQPYNMPLLRRMLELKATLLDYELVTDDRGRRLIFFGRQAGQAGMINTLWTLGQRLEVLGVENPFASMSQAKDYSSLEEALTELRRISAEIAAGGLPDRIAPLVCGITGTGNVSGGAQSVLAALDPVTLPPAALLEGRAGLDRNRVYMVVFDEPDMVTRSDGAPFDRQQYYASPEGHDGRFQDYLPQLNLLVTGNYWDPRYPRLVTRQDVAELCGPGKTPNLLVIGDVSCDPEGGIEVTLEPTYPDAPSYIYSPQNDAITTGFEGEGLAVMACEILPTELPRDSSRVFSEALSVYLPDLARADWTQPLERLGLPGPVQRAVIAHQGSLAPDWKHLL